MSQQIIKDHNVEALKVAASWPGADRATLVTLATVLAATGADHDGLSYFEALAASQPDQALPLALAGYFQVRAGEDIPAGLAKLDDAASRDLGPAQYYRGLALAPLPAEARHAEQAVADLEFILAVRDQFPSNMIRAVYHGLSAAYAATGQDDLAAKAAADSGLSSAPAEARLQFGGGWTNAADGYHFGYPRIVEVAPGVRVAQGYDFADFGFVSTEDGVIAIDAGTAEHRVRTALADAGLHAEDVSHVILTHAHFDHVGRHRRTRQPRHPADRTGRVPVRAAAAARERVPVPLFHRKRRRVRRRRCGCQACGDSGGPADRRAHLGVDRRDGLRPVPDDRR